MRSALSERRLRLPLALVVFSAVTYGGIVFVRNLIEQNTHPCASDPVCQRMLAYQEQRSHDVPTDSLVHLWVRLADASPAEAGPLAKEIGCEMSRLALRYGGIAFDQAQQRAGDSLWKAHPEVSVRARAKFNGVSPEATLSSSADCHLGDSALTPNSPSLEPTPAEVERKYKKR
jgi:hypothetical protein